MSANVNCKDMDVLGDNREYKLPPISMGFFASKVVEVFITIDTVWFSFCICINIFFFCCKPILVGNHLDARDKKTICLSKRELICHVQVG